MVCLHFGFRFGSWFLCFFDAFGLVTYIALCLLLLFITSFKFITFYYLGGLLFCFGVVYWCVFPGFSGFSRVRFSVVSSFSW